MQLPALTQPATTAEQAPKALDKGADQFGSVFGQALQGSGKTVPSKHSHKTEGGEGNEKPGPADVCARTETPKDGAAESAPAEQAKADDAKTGKAKDHKAGKGDAQADGQSTDSSDDLINLVVNAQKHLPEQSAPAEEGGDVKVDGKDKAAVLPRFVVKGGADAKTDAAATDDKITDAKNLAAGETELDMAKASETEGKATNAVGKGDKLPSELSGGTKTADTPSAKGDKAHIDASSKTAKAEGNGEVKATPSMPGANAGAAKTGTAINSDAASTINDDAAEVASQMAVGKDGVRAAKAEVTNPAAEKARQVLASLQQGSAKTDTAQAAPVAQVASAGKAQAKGDKADKADDDKATKGEHKGDKDSNLASLLGTDKPAKTDAPVTASAQDNSRINPMQHQVQQTPDAQVQSLHKTDASAPQQTVANNSAAAVPRDAQVSDRVTLVPQQRFAEALTEKVGVMLSKNLKEAHIQLDPPELGSLMIRVQVHHQDAQVQFQASHPQTREWLQDAMPRLKDMMADQGFNLADGQVRDQGTNGGESRQGQGQGGGNGGFWQGDEGEIDESLPYRYALTPDGLVDAYA